MRSFGRLAWIVLVGCVTTAHAQPLKMLEVELPQGRFVGLPIHWGTLDAVVLEPDGSMRIFDLLEVKQRLLDIEFRPQALTDARIRLQNQLGGAYETLVSGPYVIAAPNGQGRRWSDRFNALLAGYVRYFEVRGWPLRKPDFPLRIIICSNRQEFLALTSAEHDRTPKNVVGSYFPKSNRCVLYQLEGQSGVDWAETEATIVHEAVHQLAYNTGIHERLAENPRWFVEGLASMFEQPAVYDLRVSQSSVASRIIPSKRQRLQRILDKPAQLEQHLRRLVANDELFGQDPQLAYDLAWGLTFYLAERMPEQLRGYYTVLSQRAYGSYSEGQRVQDFRHAFGGEMGLIAIPLQRLFQQQP